MAWVMDWVNSAVSVVTPTRWQHHHQHISSNRELTPTGVGSGGIDGSNRGGEALKRIVASLPSTRDPQKLKLEAAQASEAAAPRGAGVQEQQDGGGEAPKRIASSLPSTRVAQKPKRIADESLQPMVSGRLEAAEAAEAAALGTSVQEQQDVVPRRKKPRTNRDREDPAALQLDEDTQHVRTSAAVVSLVAEIVSTAEPAATPPAGATHSAAHARDGGAVAEASSTQQLDDEVREQFAEFDLDGDGRISVLELRKVLRRLGVSRDLSENELAAILRQGDADGDGYITLDEFRTSPLPRPLPLLPASQPARPAQGPVAALHEVLPGWEQLSTLVQKQKALLEDSGQQATLSDRDHYLARVKTALLYELAHASGEKKQEKQKKQEKRARARAGGSSRRSRNSVQQEKVIAWLDDEILRLLGSERQCLAALGQVMPDLAHRKPVWDDGEPGVLNLRLRQFKGQLHKGGDAAFGAPHEQLRNPSHITLAELTASIATRSQAFSPDHVHQGCLGNCYLCAALSLLAKIGRSSLHSCIREVIDGATAERTIHSTPPCMTEIELHIEILGARFAPPPPTPVISACTGVGKFEVTFKKTKETRAGIRASDYVVVVDDWFWVSRASGPLCPCGNTHNEENTPVYLKTADRTAEGEIWPMVLEKAFALFLAELNLEAGTDVEPSYGLLEPGRNGLGMATAGVVFSAVTGHPFQLVGGVQKRGLTAETVDELWQAVQNGLSATVGTPRLSEAQQKALMVYSEHEYAIVRCEVYQGVECFVVRNPHNDMRRGAKGAHKLRRLDEIRKGRTEADQHILQGTGAFSRGVYLSKREMMRPGLFVTCTIMDQLNEEEEHEYGPSEDVVLR
eukprot:COSAG05_NODE_61_length_23137_cov_22.080693_12_plen_854_part_00